MSKHLNASQSVGLENEKLIIELLRKYGPTSRKQICQAIGLSNSTASDIFGRLRKKGLILEKKGESKSRGPKPIIVDINPEGGYLAGITIFSNNIFAGLFGLDLETIEIVEMRLKEIPLPEKIPQLLQKHLFKLMVKHHIAKDKLNAIGIAVPGLISEGVVKNSSPLRWKDVHLKEILTPYFDCPIYIRRLITLRGLFSECEAFYELWDQRIILHITLAHGIGGDLISDGRISYGGSGLHGEIGHIVLDHNGPLCGCGNRGCVESLISGPAIAKKILNDIKAGKQTILKTLIKNEKDTLSVINKWGQALRTNDPYALELRDYIGKHFSNLVAIAITCYDPNVIILGGYMARQCSAFLIEKIKEKMATEVCGSEYRNIRFIVSSKEEESAFVKSAARAALWELQKS